MQFKTVSNASSIQNFELTFNMLAASPTLRKQKNPVLPFSKKMRPFRKKYPYHQLPNVIRHAHAKFAPLNFKKSWEKGNKANRTSIFTKIKHSPLIRVRFTKDFTLHGAR